MTARRARVCGAILIAVISHDCAPSPPGARGTLPESTTGAGQMPPSGLAVRDEAGNWCAEFVADPEHPRPGVGRVVTIVFPGSTSTSTSTLGARIVGLRTGQCPAAFPQPRWIDYQAYRLAVSEAQKAPADTPIVGLAVASAAQWAAEPTGAARVDLDGDGVPEEARRCAADEGEHFTIWSVDPSGSSRRRWHEYYDWGALVDRTCEPGEDGL